MKAKYLNRYFTLINKKSSTCANCGKEKSLHTVGQGIKATKSIIIK